MSELTLKCSTKDEFVKAVSDFVETKGRSLSEEVKTSVADLYDALTFGFNTVTAIAMPPDALDVILENSEPLTMNSV